MTGYLPSDAAHKKLLDHFGMKNLKGYGVEHLKNGVIAAGAILFYLEQTQHTHISHIRSIRQIEENRYVRMDKFTVRSLELLGTMNEGGNSLLSVIDKTVSPMGARMLRRWVVFPLKDVKAITERQNVVEYFFREPELRDSIEELLHQIGDLERIASKVAVGRVNPREMVQLMVALKAIEPIKELCMQTDSESLHSLGERLDACIPLRERIEKELNPSPPILVNKGGVIANGVNAELDELRNIAYSGNYIPQIQQNASLIGQMDCLLSFALTAKEYQYNRPVVDESLIIDIKQGRHPVIERQMPVGEEYVANDLYLDSDKQQIIILTGPNMAGKSALLRQTALITIMAQIGSFVPADSARIGLTDKIFTRVGASDNISMGESTFMVEMNEAASILNNLSARSLVLFDELGRGTSTYDGISIAWAIVEHIHENPQAHARTLFATHYHELNEMEKMMPRVKNFNVSVKEVNGKVIFMRKLVPGGSEHSFGIHVAKIAGMAPNVVKRAEQVLKELEANNSGDGISRPKTESIQTVSKSGVQLSFFQLDDPVLCQIRDEILNLDINGLTPFRSLEQTE